MIDTTDLSSYYPGYHQYCEPKEQKSLDNLDIDNIIDEVILEKESD